MNLSQVSNIDGHNGEEASVLLDGIKNTLDIQIHHLAKRIFGILIIWRAPRGTRVRKQDINMIRRLGYLGNKAV